MTLEEFFELSLDEVRPFVPPTVMWAVEGTRRSAALAGIEPLSEEFPVWSLMGLMDCADVIFRHGVQNILTPFLTPSQFAESTPRYRERLFDWIGLLLTNPEVRDRLLRHGWRIRLLGADSLPELRAIAERLIETTPKTAPHTLWLLVVSEPDSQWRELLDAVHRCGARTRADVIRSLYGEDIVPATLLVSFGKPVISLDQLPPALIGKLDCYWTQRPGYRLTEADFRTILFDQTFVRRTWRTDKTGRAEEAREHRAAWEKGPILGIGLRLGPHWYPAPFSLPED